MGGLTTPLCPLRAMPRSSRHGPRMARQAAVNRGLSRPKGQRPQGRTCSHPAWTETVSPGRGEGSPAWRLPRDAPQHIRSASQLRLGGRPGSWAPRRCPGACDPALEPNGPPGARPPAPRPGWVPGRSSSPPNGLWRKLACRPTSATASIRTQGPRRSRCLAVGELGGTRSRGPRGDRLVPRTLA